MSTVASPTFGGRIARAPRRLAAKASAFLFDDGNPTSWLPLHEEIGPECLAMLRGKVLNAGAGDRSLAAYIPGELTNQDIPHGIHNHAIDIYSPLTAIPRPDGFFDAAVCNAVLEHVEDPDGVLNELHRVLRTGGLLYLGVPFLQPEHLDPTDFQRYTRDGLCRLVEKHGFIVQRVEPVHSIYHTLSWIVHEWLTSKRCVSYWILRKILYPILRYKTRHSRAQSVKIASVFRVIATKAG